MNEAEQREALDHIAHIKEALAEISADVKAINAQSAAMEKRGASQRDPDPRSCH
jgi:hypothetical protein